MYDPKGWSTIELVEELDRLTEKSLERLDAAIQDGDQMSLIIVELKERAEP